MDRIQRLRKDYRSLPHGYYHLCTDGWQGGKLFHTIGQFAFCIAGIALLTLKYGVQIYAFEVMPNHIHIVLSATGKQCLTCFYFLCKRINKKLKEAGLPCLPDDYWFKLVPIEDKESMRSLLIYLARNQYEKGVCTPCGHMWGTGYLLYNQLAQFLVGIKVKDLPVRVVERLIGSRTPLPPEWEIHPVLGVLPKSFVNIGKVQGLFPSVKDFMTCLVKDYESIVRIADSLGETIQWSEEEVKDIVNQLCNQLFPQKEIYTLTADEKCRIAVQADSRYHLPPKLLSRVLKLSEHVICQTLRSKDYGLRRK